MKKSSRFVDFDIHGLVGIRLINPPAHIEARLSHQLGSLRQPLLRNPDICVRFTEHLFAPGLRFLGQNRFAFTDHGFYLMGGPHSRAKTRIPLDQIGTQSHIFCEQDVPEIPLLMDILKIHILQKDCVPVHASAFIYMDQPILAATWGKGGKTTALLGFVSLGANLVGDDCVLLSGDGKQMYGLPTPLVLSDWQLRTIPYLPYIIGDVSLLRVMSLMALREIRRVVGGRGWSESVPAKILQTFATALQSRLSWRVSPERTFGNSVRLSCPAPEKCFVLLNAQEPCLEVEPANSSDVIMRLAVAAGEELKSLEEAYRAFRFAFPGKSNPLIEDAPELMLNILDRSLRRTPSYLVRHPYPIDFPALHEAMLPFCNDPEAARVESREQVEKIQTRATLTTGIFSKTAGSVQPY